MSDGFLPLLAIWESFYSVFQSEMEQWSVVFGFRDKSWIWLMSIVFFPAHKQRFRSAVFQKNVAGHGHGWDKGGGTWSTWEDKDNSLSPSPNSEIWAWWKLEGLWNPVRGFSLLFFGSAALGNRHCFTWLWRMHLLPGVLLCLSLEKQIPHTRLSVCI